MIEVKKNEKETSVGLIRRFTRRMQQSSNLMRARSIQFKNRPKSKLKSKVEALKKIKKQRRMAHLRKLGKIE
ncbi:MAG TPA: hypothetical protein ENG99_00080 [bacterium]|nr:hypothetical protein [bacterium]